jgi:hypothetical protein
MAATHVSNCETCGLSQSHAARDALRRSINQSSSSAAPPRRNQRFSAAYCYDAGPGNVGNGADPPLTTARASH